MEQKFNINDIETMEIADNPYVKDKFTSTLMRLHSLSEQEAEVIHSRETIYYKKELSSKAKLKGCTKISLFSTFLEIAINNLSIQSGSKNEAYIESRAANMGTPAQPNWVEVARFVISTYGELNLRMRAGQIVRMSNPIVLYKGDHFQPRTNDKGVLFIDYAAAIPRQSREIIGCWVAIHLPNNGIDFKWLLEDDINRLKEYSIPKGKNSSAGANALYSSANGGIDPGFLETKTIKHAMRSYTKLKVSGAAVIEGDYDDDDDAPVQTFATRSHTKIEQQQEAVVVIQEEDNDQIF